MSISLMSLVWGGPGRPANDLTTGERILLLALCDRANDEGGSCFPKVDTLAEKCGLSARRIKQLLSSLEDGGWIVREFGGGIGSHTHKTTSYRIVVERLTGVQGSSPRSSTGVKESADRGEETGSTGVKPSSPNTSVDTSRNHQVPPLPPQGELLPAPPMPRRRGAGQESPQFLEFYALYPRQQSRGDAWKAWGQMLAEGYAPVEIIEGLRRMLPELKAKFREDPTKVKLPATWLRAKCWMDAPLPQAQANGSISRHLAEWFDADGELIMGDGPAVTEIEGSWYDESNG